MHSRNTCAAPDYDALSRAYPQLREFVSKSRDDGKLHVAWSKPGTVRAVTTALLKSEFGFDVEPPVDRLTPPVPNRLNYILAIEDLLASFISASLSHYVLPDSGSSAASAGVTGVDIGTGAIAIFPLLAHAVGGWRMVASELDSSSAAHAYSTIADNRLGESVRILQILPNSASDATRTPNSEASMARLESSCSSQLATCPPAVQSDLILSDVIAASLPWVHSSTVSTTSSIMPHDSAACSSRGSPRASVSGSGVKLTGPALSRHGVSSADPDAIASSSTISLGLRVLVGSSSPMSERQSAVLLLPQMTTTPPLSRFPFSFSMCNPPFFESWEEACASMAGRSDSTCSGTAVEMAVPGGELSFVSRMIQESARPPTRDSVLWFTSMVGKHSTLAALTKELNSVACPTVRIRELFQGRTARWVIAWSWLPECSFLVDGWVFCAAASPALSDRNSDEVTPADTAAVVEVSTSNGPAPANNTGLSDRTSTNSGPAPFGSSAALSDEVTMPPSAKRSRAAASDVQATSLSAAASKCSDTTTIYQTPGSLSLAPSSLIGLRDRVAASAADEQPASTSSSHTHHHHHDITGLDSEQHGKPSATLIQLESELHVVPSVSSLQPSFDADSSCAPLQTPRTTPAAPPLAAATALCANIRAFDIILATSGGDGLRDHPSAVNNLPPRLVPVGRNAFYIEPSASDISTLRLLMRNQQQRIEGSECASSSAAHVGARLSSGTATAAASIASRVPLLEVLQRIEDALALPSPVRSDADLVLLSWKAEDDVLVSLHSVIEDTEGCLGSLVEPSRSVRCVAAWRGVAVSLSSATEIVVADTLQTNDAPTLTGTRDGSPTRASDGDVIFRFEVQLLLRRTPSSVSPITSSSSLLDACAAAVGSSDLCGIVAVSLLCSAGALGKTAFHRFADRLQRDVLRSGRSWRRKARVSP